MDEVKTYGNIDFHGLTFEDFEKKLEPGLAIDEESIEGQIEWALMYLNFKDSPIRAYEGMNQFGIKKFDGVNLLCDRVGAYGKKLDVLNPKNREVVPSVFDYDINFKYLSFNKNAQMKMFKTLGLKEKRGICNPNEHAYQRSFAFATNDEKWYYSQQNFRLCTVLETPKKEDMLKGLNDLGITKENPFVIEDGKWKGSYDYYQVLKLVFPNSYLYPIPDQPNQILMQRDINEYMNGSIYNEEINGFHAMLSIMLTHHYEWHLYIKESEHSVGFKIPIDPSSYNEIFSLKHQPTGTERKKAILHFVKEHSRKISIEKSDNSIMVRRYLRGETKFNWNGLIVELIPSRSDIINTKTKKKFLEI